MPRGAPHGARTHTQGPWGRAGAEQRAQAKGIVSVQDIPIVGVPRFVRGHDHAVVVPRLDLSRRAGGAEEHHHVVVHEAVVRPDRRRLPPAGEHDQKPELGRAARWTHFSAQWPRRRECITRADSPRGPRPPGPAARRWPRSRLRIWPAGRSPVAGTCGPRRRRPGHPF